MTTNLIRWTPQADFIRDRVSRLFDESFSDFLAPVGTGSEGLAQRGWVPPVDIRETDNELMLHVEIPGMRKEDVNITLENNVLTIGGERKFEKDTKKENYHRLERAYGKFSRSFSLPANVRTDSVDASFSDGVLTVTLPKADEAKPRKIEIR